MSRPSRKGQGDPDDDDPFMIRPNAPISVIKAAKYVDRYILQASLHVWLTGFSITCYINIAELHLNSQRGQKHPQTLADSCSHENRSLHRTGHPLHMECQAGV